MKTVAIVGGGFCGTLTAVNLVRLSSTSLQVLLINVHYPIARGVAYGTRRPEHLLNVVARDMSAFLDIPSHFVDWLRTRAEFKDIPPADLREKFIPRQIYGDYLQSLLFSATQPLGMPSPVKIDLIDDEVTDIIRDSCGSNIILQSGKTFQADRVLLATGNVAPRDIAPPDSVQGHAAYCPNPWDLWYEKLPDPREDILLVGTGLTMIDSLLTLRALGWNGKVHAVSRNGQLPLTYFKSTDYVHFLPDEPWTQGLHALVRLMEEHCARLRSEGKKPDAIVDKLRPHIQRIWRSFSLAEKQEFCQKYRARWNILRHRIPPVVAAQIQAELKLGTLCIHQGCLRNVQSDGPSIRVTVKQDNVRPPLSITAGLMVNCTGPQESISESTKPLYRNLIRRGLIQPDKLDMGIDVSPDFAVIGKEGNPSEFLYAIGPLLKGTLWETIAVPELRDQTYQMAQILDSVSGTAESRGRKVDN